MCCLGCQRTEAKVSRALGDLTARRNELKNEIFATPSVLVKWIWFVIALTGNCKSLRSDFFSAFFSRRLRSKTGIVFLLEPEMFVLKIRKLQLGTNISDFETCYKGKTKCNAAFRAHLRISVNVQFWQSQEKPGPQAQTFLAKWYLYVHGLQPEPCIFRRCYLLQGSCWSSSTHPCTLLT